MIIAQYLDSVKQELIREVYDEEFLRSIDSENFLEVYRIFEKYGFYFIDDIILNDLELFLEDPSKIESGILKLKEELGPDFVKKIGIDMRYLEQLYDEN